MFKRPNKRVRPSTIGQTSPENLPSFALGPQLIRVVLAATIPMANQSKVAQTIASSVPSWQAKTKCEL